MAFNPFEFALKAAALARNAQKMMQQPEQFTVFGRRQDRQEQLDPIKPPPLTGLRRFNAERKRFGYDVGTPEFDNWVLTLKPDPGDGEYNNLLFDMQRRAQLRIRRREQESTPGAFTAGMRTLQDTLRGIGRPVRDPNLLPQGEQEGLDPFDPSRFRRDPNLLPQPEDVDEADIETRVKRRPGEESEPQPEEGPEDKKEQPEAAQPFEAPTGPRVTVLGPDGKPLPNQFIAQPDGTLVDVSSRLEVSPLAALGELDPEVQQDLQQELGPEVMGAFGEMEAAGTLGGETLMAGQYVWMGGTPGQPAYMSAEHAVQLPYYWSTDQILYAQEALGMDPTGFADPGLINEWSKVVATSAGYTAAGRNVDPLTVLDWVHAAVMAQGGSGGGGGGGGGGGRGLTRSETSSVLRQVMLDELGREPTPDEANGFHAAMGGVGLDADVFQLAVEWVRNQAGGEAATFQVASDFYSAMLEVLQSPPGAAEAMEV